jgi:DNA-binding response OmpR family regulator
VETKKRILVVDDEARILNVLRIKLRLSGYDVVTTTGGVEAVEIIRNQAPDLVLLDMLMPGVTGVNVIDQVRAFSKVPILVFSAKLDTSQQALEHGADGFIAKPFDPDQLVAKIEAVLKKTGQGTPKG